MPGPHLFEDPGWDVHDVQGHLALLRPGQFLTGWARMSALQFLFKQNARCIFRNSCLRQTTCFGSLVRLMEMTPQKRDLYYTTIRKYFFDCSIVTVVRLHHRHAAQKYIPRSAS